MPVERHPAGVLVLTQKIDRRIVRRRKVPAELLVGLVVPLEVRHHCPDHGIPVVWVAVASSVDHRRHTRAGRTSASPPDFTVDSTDIRDEWAERSGEYSPAYYAYYGADETSELVQSISQSMSSRTRSVLDVGCSSGRHLAARAEAGYSV